MQSLIDDGYHRLIAKSVGIKELPNTRKNCCITLCCMTWTKRSIAFQKLLSPNEKICVVADYDVDGATSCAIMVKDCVGWVRNVNYFVPNRFKHGYGLQPSVIDDMLLSYPDTDMIVTVDNGISSIAGVQYAKRKTFMCQ